MREAVLRAFKSVFCSDHGLRQDPCRHVAVLARLAVYPDELTGSLIGHIYELCHGYFGVTMDIAAGRIDKTLVRAPQQESGLIDSRLVMTGNCQASICILRLLTC